MSKVVKLRKGLDIKLNGEAEKKVVPTKASSLYGVKPTDFRALTPRLAVKVGDQVKAGDTLFFNKYKPEIKFSAPVSGTVESINRGERRKLLEVVVKADKEIQYKDFGAADVNKLPREAIVEKLLDSGVWPVIRQRPYDIIANPSDTPKAVFVSGFDSAPLAPDYDFTLAGEQEVMRRCSRAMIIRTAWLYSEYGNNFVKTMLRLGRERETLGVVFDQIGTPTYAGDLAKAIYAAIEQGLVPGIYHFSNEGVCSWYDFTVAIHRLAGITTCKVSPLHTDEYPAKAPRPHYSVLDKTKIKQTFGIDIPHWETSLENCLQKLNIEL